MFVIKSPDTHYGFSKFACPVIVSPLLFFPDEWVVITGCRLRHDSSEQRSERMTPCNYPCHHHSSVRAKHFSFALTSESGCTALWGYREDWASWEPSAASICFTLSDWLAFARSPQLKSPCKRLWWNGLQLYQSLCYLYSTMRNSINTADRPALYCLPMPSQWFSHIFGSDLQSGNPR